MFDNVRQLGRCWIPFYEVGLIMDVIVPGVLGWKLYYKYIHTNLYYYVRRIGNRKADLVLLGSLALIANPRPIKRSMELLLR